MITFAPINFSRLLLISIASLYLSACGGGGSSSEDTSGGNTPTPPSYTASISVSTQGSENGPTDIVYQVALSATNASGSSIVFDVSDTSTGSATSGSDYTFPSNATISIANGANSGNITITVIDDSEVESTETVIAQISTSNSSISSITTNTATADIVDNDTTSTDAFSVNAHTLNSLMVLANVTTATDSTVQIQFESANTDSQITSASTLGTQHDFTVVGLRAETSYQFTAQITDSTGNVTSSQTISFTTGSLPANIPAVTLVANTVQSLGGITFFASTDTATSQFIGVDEEGFVVWYMHQTANMSAAPVVKVLDGGRLMLLLNREVRIVDITGETLESYTLPAYHHEAVLMPNGNMLILTYEQDTFNGQLLKGDRIVELDPQGNEVWAWSSFDHLDTNRFPGALSTRTDASGAMDWTHSNALFYNDHDDAIMLSSRSQSWVINIDHASGDIIWIMGKSNGADASFNGKFFTLNSGNWMASQHAPMLNSLGDILIYDNRNESDVPGSTNNSRAVRFSIDTVQMTAEQTWEFVAPKYTQSLGDVDELNNGNVLLNAGGPGGGSDIAHIVEVTSETPAQVAWEISIADTNVYRAERMSWNDFLITSVQSDSGGTTPISDLIDIANCAEAINFVDTNNPDNYIDFDLDGQTNGDIYGEELIPSLSVTCDADVLYVNANGATNFDWSGGAASSPQAIPDEWTLPRNPTIQAQNVALPLLGPIAISATGLQIFGPNENGADNYANPVTDGLMNYCGGHTRDYHFHQKALCFFDYQTMGGDPSLLPNNEAGVVVGYSLDGFPIMSPYECSDASCSSVDKIESSYRYTGTGDYANENAWDFHSYEESLSPLDECNGMTRPDGSYAYYATDGWPYYMGCYRGPTDLVGDNNRQFNP